MFLKSVHIHISLPVFEFHCFSFLHHVFYVNIKDNHLYQNIIRNNTCTVRKEWKKKHLEELKNTSNILKKKYVMLISMTIKCLFLLCLCEVQNSHEIHLLCWLISKDFIRNWGGTGCSIWWITKWKTLHNFWKYRVTQIKFAHFYLLQLLNNAFLFSDPVFERQQIFRFSRNFQLFVYNFSKSTISKTHFGFTNVGSEVHSFSFTAIYYWKFSNGTPCT